MEKLDCFPKPKYHEIVLDSDKLKIMIKALKRSHSVVVLETLLEVFANIDYKFNSYDVIGIKDPITKYTLPDIIIIITENSDINFTLTDDKDKVEFMETKFYNLPAPICYVDIREIEKQYKFPFSSHI